jgi:hypothetical protein
MWSEEKMKDLEKVNDILFKIKSQTNNVIFIYTPPKVGSTALVSSLRISAAYKYSVLHIHDEIMLSAFTGYSNITINDLILYNKKIGKNVFVIDIFRTPIERKISEFFEKLSSLHFNNSEENLCNYSLDRIISRFNKIFPYLSDTDYFKSIYNIEVPEKFDFEKKYMHVVCNEINYIKLRLCDSKEWNNILSELLQTEIIIVHDYETKNKKIGELYKKFKANYKIPCNLLNEVKEKSNLDFYLSEEERKRYYDFWEKNVSGEYLSYTKKQYDFYIRICLENRFCNDFQPEHYMDVGCICRPCSQKRLEQFMKAKNGEKITEKIIHDENIVNLQKNIISNLKEKIKKININKPIVKGKPIKNILKDIVGRKRG